MKRLIVIVMMLGAALGAWALPAAAQQDITSLAGYFPADAPIFVSFRTDDQFIDQLDSLAAQIGSAVPGGLMPGSLHELLDMQVANIQPGGTFADTIRPWLGDFGAFGITHLDLQSSQPPMTIALSLTDQAKAEALISDLLPTDAYTVTEGDGFSEYTPTGTSDKTYLVFRSDVVIITTDQVLADAGGVPTATLADQTDYQAAIQMLPADQYNGVAYLDTPSFLKAIMSDQPTTSQSNAAAMGMLTNALTSLKPQAFGLTVLNDRALTIDIASPLAAGAPMMLDAHPVDPAFVQHLAAGVPLVMHGTNLYSSYQQAIDTLQMVAQQSDNPRDAQDFETAIWAFGFALRGLTGMEPDAALGWMSGDYALEIGLSASASDATGINDLMAKLPLDFGLVIQGDSNAQTFFDGLTRSLSNFPARELTVTQDTLDGGAPALVLTITTKDMPFPVELVASAGNGVFAFGTRRLVTAAVNPNPANNLETDAQFVEAGATLLADPIQVLYLSGDGLQPLARVIAQMSPDQGSMMQSILGLISSASISTSVLPDNSGELVRLVWTLPQ